MREKCPFSILVLTVPLFLLMMPVTNGQGTTIPEDIDFAAQYLMDYYKVPGSSLVIVNNDSVYYTTAYGFKNVENKEYVTTDTLFSIGSLTKAFTATLMVKHLAEINATLDTPLLDILGNKSVILSDRFRTEYITPRDLMSHRTCLDPNNLALVAGSLADRDDYIRRQKYLTEVCGFRTLYVYNNQMFTLAGWVLEQITGKKWEQLVREELLTPLGMNGTKYMFEVVKHFDSLDAATPYYYERSDWVPVDIVIMDRVTPENPCGGITSSANDMGKWLLFHLNNGEGLVNPAVLDQLYSGVISMFAEYNIPIPEFYEIYHSYAQAFMIGVTNDNDRYAHSGYWSNQASQISLFPKLKMGIFSIANGPGSSRAGSYHLLLHDIIFQFLTVGSSFKVREFLESNAPLPVISNMNDMVFPHVVPKSFRMEYASESNNEINYHTEMLIDTSRYVGTYGNLSYANLTINATDDGGLYLNFHWLYGPLEPTSTTNKFHLNMTESPIKQDLKRSSIDILFQDNNGVQVQICDLTFNGFPYRFVRNLKLSDGPAVLWNSTSC